MKKMILSVIAATAMLTSCKEAEDKAIDRDVVTVDSTTVVETDIEIPDSATVMKAWQDNMTPGDVHKMLASENGKWNEEMTMWMSPDDKNPQKHQLVAESKMILGGRFQEVKHTGNIMGQNFEGISNVGYDNAAKQIVSTWIDNFGTGIMTMRGTFDGDSKVITLQGEVTDPVSGKRKPVREIYTIVDNDTRKMEMFDVDYHNKEYKSMEIIMKRAK